MTINTSKTTTEELSQKIHSVSFCQFLRCLQIEKGTRIGTEAELSKQSCKLVVDLDASFPANELAAWMQSETRPKLAVSFFGLFGASGALPHHYTQTIIERSRQKDHTLREFLDIFNHRQLSLFYRAWEKHSFPVAFETASASKTEDTVTKAIWGLIGNRFMASRNRLAVKDDYLLYYSGQFSSSRPSIESIRVCVQDMTGIPTEVEPLVGQWLMLDKSDQSQIGSSPNGMSMGNNLGVDSMAGERIWDVENRFRVTVGPVDWNTFNEYLPSERRLRILTDFVRRYVGPQFDFDFRVLLKKEEVKGVVLAEGTSVCLGWNTWLGNWDSPLDAGDALFELPDILVA